MCVYCVYVAGLCLGSVDVFLLCICVGVYVCVSACARLTRGPVGASGENESPTQIAWALLMCVYCVYARAGLCCVGMFAVMCCCVYVLARYMWVA